MREIKQISVAKLLIIVVGMILLNLFAVDVLLLKQETGLQQVQVQLPKPSPVLIPLPACPQSCITQIQQATESIKLQPSPITVSQNAASTIKELYVSFGAGSNSTEEWADVVGAGANIDNTKYGVIKSVVFEASVHIPTGNEYAYVRLFNKTDKHPVWFSEVSLNGGASQLLISNPITLDSGNKLYQVQMKTQLKYPAILDQSRVHILTF